MKVSPWSAEWSSTKVAPVLKSTGAPQLEQKRPVEEISALQDEQTMAGGFYHCAFGWRWRAGRLLGGALDLHGGAVGEDFGHALHDFGGVVAHGDYGVGAMLGGVL